MVWCLIKLSVVLKHRDKCTFSRSQLI